MFLSNCRPWVLMLTVLGQILRCAVGVCITRHGCFSPSQSGQPQLSPISTPYCNGTTGCTRIPPLPSPSPLPAVSTVEIQTGAGMCSEQVADPQVSSACTRHHVLVGSLYFSLAVIPEVFCCLLLYGNLESTFLMPGQKKTEKNMQTYQQWRVDSSLCTCAWKEGQKDWRIL